MSDELMDDHTIPRRLDALRRQLSQSTTRSWFLTAMALVMAVALSAAPLLAQDGSEKLEHLEFDRPEAWALKYFNSVALFTGLGPPRDRERWSFELGLELDIIPHLDEDQRRVGFNGIKVEDLNKLPVFFRPRLAIGLPHRWTLDLSYVPPITVAGVTPHLLALALERPMFEHGRWVLGIRAYGQIGEMTGDFTCPEEQAENPPGSPGNIWGCEEPSSDTSSLNSIGLAFTGGVGFGVTTLHWGLAANYMDMEFQVDAINFGVHDRTRLVADGWTWSLNTGASWSLWERIEFGVEIFYSPLSVERPPSQTVENDPLINLRTILRFHL